MGKITKEYLGQFCASEDTKYLIGKPAVFTHPDTKGEYSFATDGHRIVITEGRIDGLADYNKLNISFCLIEPRGVPVSTVSLRSFIKCVPTKACRECHGRGGMVSCECSRCGHAHEYECQCEGGRERIENRGVIGVAPINRSLLMGTLDGVEDETVLVFVESAEKAVFIFCSDRRIAVMPMRNDSAFDGAPKFAVATTEAK